MVLPFGFYGYNISVKFSEKSGGIMERAAYIVLGIVAFCWILAMVAGFIILFPMGLIGLLVILGFGLILIKVLKERLANKEDDYYDKNVEK